VLRVAPTDHGIAFRLAEYLIPKRPAYRRLRRLGVRPSAGEDALRSAFSRNQSSLAGDYSVPADALDVAPQVLRARRAHATALLVWGRPATIAATITAARTAGWNVPVYTSPTGADPFVRQQLADHPDWVDGLTFAGGRLTAEVGVEDAVSTSTWVTSTRFPSLAYVAGAAGATMVGKPWLSRSYRRASDWAIVALVVIVAIAGTAGGHQGAERGDGAGRERRPARLQPAHHEGVVDDDVYFARFHDMTYAPVQDDPLSKTLPTVSQIR
jgi:hypothetical protein